MSYGQGDNRQSGHLVPANLNLVPKMARNDVIFPLLVPSRTKGASKGSSSWSRRANQVISYQKVQVAKCDISGMS